MRDTQEYVEATRSTFRESRISFSEEVSTLHGIDEHIIDLMLSIFQKAAEEGETVVPSTFVKRPQ
jgi:hypothetical protein